MRIAEADPRCGYGSVLLGLPISSIRKRRHIMDLPVYPRESMDSEYGESCACREQLQ
jgi:hypothetical protein